MPVLLSSTSRERGDGGRDEISRQEDIGKSTGCTGMWLQVVSENSTLVIFLTSISIEKCSSHQPDCAVSQHS
jgi:hypothetical protein